VALYLGRMERPVSTEDELSMLYAGVLREMLQAGKRPQGKLIPLADERKEAPVRRPGPSKSYCLALYAE
jgi:hypothetical protein